MFYLLETPVGLAIFKKTDQISIVSKMRYPSSNAALEIINSLNSSSQLELAPVVENFIKENIPVCSDLNVLSEELALFIKKNFNINAVCNPDQDFRMLKKNSFKWFEVNKDVYNAMLLRIAHKISNNDDSDVSIINTLDTIEELDKSINNRTMRIRDWYSLHFPELNTIADNLTYLKMLLLVGNRKNYLEKTSKEDIPDEISPFIANSMGTEMMDEDINKIIENTNDIFKSIAYKNNLSGYLLTKCKKEIPNLYTLVGELVASKLIRKAGSLTNLSLLPSSTIQILGAEKAYNEAVKSLGNTPKHGIIFESSYIYRAADPLKGKVARKLSSKIALCSKVDAFGSSIDGEFGKKIKEELDKEFENMESVNKSANKQIHQQKRRIVSVTEYDQSKDTKNQKIK